MELIHNTAQILGALLAVAILYAIPKVASWIKVDGNAIETQELLHLILSFVQAAEQLLKENDPTGEARMTYVKEQLENMGYAVTDTITAMIEGAVWEVNHSGMQSAAK